MEYRFRFNKYYRKQTKKPSCPFGRKCFTDSTVCGFIGYYAECPRVIDYE